MVWRALVKNNLLIPSCLCAVLCTTVLLWLWYPNDQASKQMRQYGEALAHTLAHTSAGHLLHKDQIELAVVANQVVSLPEVAGVVFYNAQNEIVAVNGNHNRGAHFTASKGFTVLK